MSRMSLRRRMSDQMTDEVAVTAEVRRSEAEVRRSEAEVRRSEAESALLSCRGVDVAYDKVQVLFGVDIAVQEGEIVALLGTNGAGKSTLLRAVSGLVDPIGGEIWFDGH